MIALLVALLAGGDAWALSPRDLLVLPDAADRFAMGDAADVADGAWWTQLNDPALTRVPVWGRAATPAGAPADARMAQARAASVTALSGLLPSASVDLNGQGAPQRALLFRFGGGMGPPPEGLYYTGGVGLSAGWQLDVFGRGYTAWRAALGDQRASAADRDGFVLALSQTLATAYFDVVAGRAREAVALTQKGVADVLLELTELRATTGAGDELDVLQQRQQVASARSLVAQSQMGRRVAEVQLGVLLALPVGAPIADVPATLPDPGPAPSVGTPMDLLARRPDLLAAESRLSSASQRTLSAGLSLLPTVRVQASTGRDWFKTDTTQTQDSWSVGGSLSIPLFNGGRTWAGVSRARAGEMAAAAAYGKAVLTAIGAVDVAVAQDVAAGESLLAVEDQTAAARLAFDAAKARYADGVEPFVTVLLTESTLRVAELSLVQAHRDALATRVRLHTALGGTWLDAYGFDADGMHP